MNNSSVACPPSFPDSLYTQWDSEVVSGFLTLTFVVLGVVINTFSIMVLRSLRRRSIQNYLIALAVWDNLLLVSATLMYAFSTTFYGERVMSGAYVRVYPLAFYSSQVALTGTLWMIVALTVDRYRFVLYPIKFRPSPHQQRDISVAIVVLSAVALLIGLPQFFELQLGTCDGDVPLIDTTALRRSRLYRVAYVVVGGVLTKTVFPVALLVFLMSRITFELYRARSRRRKMSAVPSMVRSLSVTNRNGRLIPAPRRKKNTDNHMLFCVVAKFFLARSLTLALDIAETLNPTVAHSNTFTHLTHISNLLVVLNSATNFWVYVLVGCRFRQQSAQLLRRFVGPRVLSAAGFDLSPERTTNGSNSFETKQDMIVSIRGEHESSRSCLLRPSSASPARRNVSTTYGGLDAERRATLVSRPAATQPTLLVSPPSTPANLLRSQSLSGPRPTLRGPPTLRLHMGKDLHI